MFVKRFNMVKVEESLFAMSLKGFICYIVLICFLCSKIVVLNDVNLKVRLFVLGFFCMSVLVFIYLSVCCTFFLV